jgi:hypothetical protein
MAIAAIAASAIDLSCLRMMPSRKSADNTNKEMCLKAIRLSRQI